MMIAVTINVVGWVATEVSVDDDWQPGDDIPPDALVDGVNSSWDDSHFEVTGVQVDE